MVRVSLPVIWSNFLCFLAVSTSVLIRIFTVVLTVVSIRISSLPCFCYKKSTLLSGKVGKISHGSNSWLKVYEANYGYGIDIASIYYNTTIAWEIHPNKCDFDGTCDAAALTAGMLALLKQRYNPLGINQSQVIFRYTGDQLGYPPINNETEMSGYYSGIEIYTENQGYQQYGDLIGWGILDAYEAYLYMEEYIIQ
jgi:hypothetical protein